MGTVSGVNHVDAVVVLLVGATARASEARDFLTPEVHEMVIEELAAVVGMQMVDWEGQAGDDADRTQARSGFPRACPRYLARSDSVGGIVRREFEGCLLTGSRWVVRRGLIGGGVLIAPH